MKKKISSVMDIALVVIPIIFGGLIYFFFYPDSVLINKFISDNFQSLIYSKNFIKTLLPLNIYNTYIQSFPSGLWSFSFMYSQLIIHAKNKRISFSAKLLLSLNILIIICFEIFQNNSVNIIPGTYDLNDLISSVFGIFIAYLIHLFRLKKI